MAVRSAFPAFIGVYTLVWEAHIPVISMVTVAEITSRNVDTSLLTSHTTQQTFVYV